jgi:hypothetical protein
MVAQVRPSIGDLLNEAATHQGTTTGESRHHRGGRARR